ncbi:hypothetical protein D3C85_1687770 [compost metagenome]
MLLNELMRQCDAALGHDVFGKNRNIIQDRLDVRLRSTIVRSLLAFRIGVKAPAPSDWLFYDQLGFDKTR